MTPWLVVAVVVGVLLLWGGRGIRKRRGLSQETTLALDDRRLFSVRLRLAGRPDRIVEGNIPEEWKFTRRAHNSHRAQLGVYFRLIEVKTGVPPPHGFIVLGSGERVKIENTPELWQLVRDVAEKIRAGRRHLDEVVQMSQPAAKCRGCGMREVCGQRRF